MSEVQDVKTVAEFEKMPEEYQLAIRKLVRSHAINELYGAQVFDEPAIEHAPNPYAKWLTCRVAMEEYGHHVRFRELGLQIGLDDESMSTKSKKPLSIFEYKLKNWAEFCTVKMFADLAEILQVEDLLHCSFLPLRNLARSTMPEEKFHADFGVQFGTELIKTAEGKAALQQAVNDYFPYLPSFFGGSGSANNEIYRKWRIKLRKNEDMREDFMARAQKVADALGLRLPEAREAA